ncbi:MAG: hypothetical protein QXG90_05615 [Candidatus Nezhaarchaeales archaeon]
MRNQVLRATMMRVLIGTLNPISYLRPYTFNALLSLEVEEGHSLEGLH